MPLEKIKIILNHHGFSRESSVLDITHVQNSANEAFIVAIKDDDNEYKIFLKIYNSSEGRAVKSCDLWIREILPPSISVPKILASGIHEGRDYAIMPYIEGITLLEKTTLTDINEADFIALSSQLSQFLRDCTAIPLEGFGSLDKDSKQGQYTCLSDFIRNNIQNAYNLFTSAHLEDGEIIEHIEKYKQVLDTYLENNHDYFDHASSRLIPLDLNLNNFIVTHDNTVLLADLESFAAGDTLLAYGEWYGHVYNSPLGKYFQKEYEKFSTEEQKTIHFYALLGCFNIFCFCVAHHISNLKELTPWGNPNTFMVLMQAHEEKMDMPQHRLQMRY